jgi:thioredoxin reductase (NADPH)
MGAEPAGGTPVDHIVRDTDGTFTVGAGDAFEVTCNVVVLAVGLTWAKLPVGGADRFEGAGIFYGAARSEARSVAGKRVVVVGGANSAGQAAVFLADAACDVVIVMRGDSPKAKMSQYLVDQIGARDNIEVLVRAEVVGVDGDDHLRTVTIQGPHGRSQLDVAGMFVFIGAKPRTDWLPDWIERDGHGYILTGPAVAGPDAGEYATSQPGVFAVGDVRAGSVKRVASAIGEGSIVVPAIHRHLAATRSG